MGHEAPSYASQGPRLKNGQISMFIILNIRRLKK